MLLLLLFGCRTLCTSRPYLGTCWLLLLFAALCCMAPLSGLVLRMQVMRFKPVVLIRAVISTWPCCFCFGSGRGGVMLFLLATNRAAQFVLLTQ